MNIIIKPLKWKWALYPFTGPPKYLVLHHEAGNGSVEQIHAYHQSLGWNGIAYHLYVRKDGNVYAGRPMDRKGGHCSNYNSVSIGICFEGNFENDVMGERQRAAGAEAVEYALGLYPRMKIVGHRELVATACPGHNFPLNYYKEIGADFRMTGQEIYNRVQDYLATLPAPDWAEAELREAVEAGITDGTNPMQLIPRYQAALLALRALKQAKNLIGLAEGDDGK